MRDPIATAFRKIIEEIYWTDSLEEAEKILEDHLNKMDEDLREILLARRREICNGQEAVVSILKIDALAEAAEEESIRNALFLRSMIETMFLAQCTEKWHKMTPAEKSKILAPLYRASYGLELAMKSWPDSIDQVHLENVENNLHIAYERAQKISLLEELSKYLENKAQEIFGEYNNSLDKDRN